jgi:phage shock protein E
MSFRSLASILLLALGGCLFALSGDTSGRDAQSLVKQGALLLDVRTPGEFADRHLEGATNIPVQELGARMSEVGAKDRVVVVYCRSGHRSGNAAAMLRDAGYTRVHDLGAMSRWPD